MRSGVAVLDLAGYEGATTVRVHMHGRRPDLACLTVLLTTTLRTDPLMFVPVFLFAINVEDLHAHIVWPV